MTKVSGAMIAVAAWSLWLLLLSSSTILRQPLGVVHAFHHHHHYSRSSRSGRRFGLPRLAAAASINEGRLTVERPIDGDKSCPKQQRQSNHSSFELYYQVFRPMNLNSQQAAPLVVLHGGPSVPCDYLLPLKDVIPYRSLVFYDQLGCGRSDEPPLNDTNRSPNYSIDLAVQDLEALLRHLGVRRFHLYGQSFGGILAYEFLKRRAISADDDAHLPECLSVILSSTPSNVTQVEAEAGALLEALAVANSNSNSNNSTDLADAFRLAHQCRTPVMPAALQAAYDHAGTTWRGTTAIADYAAKPLPTSSKRLPSALVLRGEHDFVTPACVADWTNGSAFWNHPYVRSRTLPGCSHHGLLEQPALYGDVLESFCAEYD